MSGGVISEDQWGKYLRAKEPGVREKAYAWKTVIGLQKVDGLTPSDFLIETAKKNIEGEITLKESRKRIEGYYISLPAPEGKLVPSKREQVGEQVKTEAVVTIAAKSSKFVQRLVEKIKGEMTVLEMMAALKLGGRRNFLEKYLSPAIDVGLVEMTQPDSPRSPTQRYRLTSWGQKVREGEALERAVAEHLREMGY